MPCYNYHCQACDEYFEIQHAMTENQENCLKCDSLEFKRVLSVPLYVKKINKNTQDAQPGSLVEEYIEKNRQAVKEEKNRLSKQEYKP